MARVLIIESGDDFRAIELPADWDTDDIDRYLSGRAYGRAAVVTVEPNGFAIAQPDTAIVEMRFEGVVYAVEVGHDEDGRTNVRFMTDPPPRGMDRVRYEWTGRLVNGRKPMADDDPDDFLPTGGGEYGGGSV
jgi:hypothetical protein